MFSMFLILRKPENQLFPLGKRRARVFSKVPSPQPSPRGRGGFELSTFTFIKNASLQA